MTIGLPGDEIVDVWMQQPNQRFLDAPWWESLRRWSGEPSAVPPLGSTVHEMDKAGVGVGLLSAWHAPGGVLISNDEVAEVVRQHPDRFAGVAAVDLNDPVGAVREIRRCVRDLGFVGVRVVPWVWNLPPNDRRYYPVYVACVEEDVPFCTQIGHTGPLCPSEPGRPIPYLDEVLLDFPDLVVLGGHVGYPWMAEVLSLATKYPNFYVDTSAYALHRLPAELVEFLRGRGRGRVLFGTNYPMITASKALRRLDELGLDDEARELFLGGNARKLFALPTS
ncbi:amidohydrolase family protein [Amycolatopsis nigrescens]|uniref:amidohydrolase family protein n=1 Tax=Amycolatopsis nigrescens TaxID=381445 RepID=UPI0003756F7C|nr:amidohydrolase family protein [Amycolatopsis nigrescens]